MPILPAEPEMYPDHLLQTEIPRTEARRWWCLHTKPRQEKLEARVLRNRSISYYLPQVEFVHRTPGGRKVKSVIPLFPGYLFLHGDDYECVEAMRGNHLANVLRVPNQPALERDLRQIHCLLTSGLAIAPEPTFTAGDSVRIMSGPLKGLVGTIVRRSGRERFLAAVRFLGRGVTVEVEDWQLESA